MKYLVRLAVVLYIVCLASLVCLYGWSVKEFNRIVDTKEAQRVKPIYIKIVEYADDDPEIVVKVPEDIIEETEDEIIEEVEEVFIVPEMVLNANIGRVQGPQEIEKYYNLPMDGVVQTMRNKGYTEEDYPYYVREDGVKMLGDFIMVAADLNKYPRGTVVQTSLGQGLVCDKHETDSNVIDIAVEW